MFLLFLYVSLGYLCLLFWYCFVLIVGLGDCFDLSVGIVSCVSCFCWCFICWVTWICMWFDYLCGFDVVCCYFVDSVVVSLVSVVLWIACFWLWWFDWLFCWLLVCFWIRSICVVCGLTCVGFCFNATLGLVGWYLILVLLFVGFVWLHVIYYFGDLRVWFWCLFVVVLGLFTWCLIHLILCFA